MRIKLMSKVSGLLMICSLIVCGNLSAQDSEIGQAELRKYALLSEVIDLMKKDLSAEVNKMIKSQDGMTGQRYKELAATKGDEAKLTEIGAKDYEVKFLGLITDLKGERTKAIKLVNQELATKMIGNRGKTYKAIKSELAANADLKAQYDEILISIKSQGTSD